MLIAQIVEAVRQDKLYLPSRAEQKKSRPGNTLKSAKPNRRRVTMALIIITAAVVDLLIIIALNT